MQAWIRKRFWGLLVGAVVTATVAITYVLGYWSWLTLPFLDFQFRYVNQAHADPRIVMIDINDVALERVGRWPWPRRMQADLVELLGECGARAVVLDLVYSEPMDGRIDHPELEAESTFDPPSEVHGEVLLSDAIWDDDELADAIRSTPRVYTAMFAELTAPDLDRYERRKNVRRIIDRQPDISPDALAGIITTAPGESVQEILQLARIDGLLRRDFGLTVAQIAEKLNLAPAFVEQRISQSKEIAARHLVATYLDKHPQASFADVFMHLLRGESLHVLTRDRQDLREAYRRERAFQATAQHALPEHPTYAGVIPNGLDATVPIRDIGRACNGVGLASFRKDVDGVLRHVPLIARVDGRIIMQLGFALAHDVLAIDPASMRVTEGHVLTMQDRAGQQQWHIPLNRRGEMLLNWHVNADDRRWQGSFHHVPAARLMEVASNRRSIEQNRYRLRQRFAEAVELRYGQAESAYLDYERKVRRLIEMQRKEDFGPEYDALRSTIDRIERESVAEVARLAKQIIREGLTPQNEAERKQFDQYLTLYEQLEQGELIRQLQTKNKRLRERNETLLAELRQRVGGKLCFVGHTASAHADMVNSPVFKDMPGVMAHANLVNTLLVGRIPTVAPRSVTVVLILITGAIVTVLTSSQGPWLSFFSVLGMIALLLGVSSLAIWQWSHWLASVVPAAGVFVSWALITLFRQLTEERQRRLLARALARNTSPAIAAKITEQLDDLDLVPQPAEVTCYFSDLQGFTSISERLGADQTKSILNAYLGVMGEVLIEHRAFNKFMGDGIFAFFNAPLWPIEDHARTGCEAALATAQRLTKLQADTTSPYATELQQLRMRIGLHTGTAFVGYFGSENQTDYTCIGDTVNLAARLEPANKVFGTSILVSGTCRDRVCDHFEFRHLGGLQVKGRAQAEPVYELLGRCGEVDEQIIGYAGRFSEAVAMFQSRRWVDAARCFDECQRHRPADVATALYLTEIERLRDNPPAEDWNQAIELTTK